jgi:hypothetical protein
VLEGGGGQRAGKSYPSGAARPHLPASRPAVRFSLLLTHVEIMLCPVFMFFMFISFIILLYYEEYFNYLFIIMIRTKYCAS